MLEHNLTSREKEIAECLIKGMSIKEISKSLNISVYTVQIHRRNIKIRLNAKNPHQVGFLLGKLINN